MSRYERHRQRDRDRESLRDVSSLLWCSKIGVNIQALAAARYKDEFHDVVIIAVGEGPVDHGGHDVVGLRTLTATAPLGLTAHTGRNGYLQVRTSRGVLAHK